MFAIFFSSSICNFSRTVNPCGKDEANQVLHITRLMSLRGRRWVSHQIPEPRRHRPNTNLGNLNPIATAHRLVKKFHRACTVRKAPLHFVHLEDFFLPPWQVHPPLARLVLFGIQTSFKRRVRVPLGEAWKWLDSEPRLSESREFFKY
jgi:hypothetical protein